MDLFFAKRTFFCIKVNLQKKVQFRMTSSFGTCPHVIFPSYFGTPSPPPKGWRHFWMAPKVNDQFPNPHILVILSSNSIKYLIIILSKKDISGKVSLDSDVNFFKLTLKNQTDIVGVASGWWGNLPPTFVNGGCKLLSFIPRFGN